MITVNNHIHSKYSRDAKGEIMRIIKKAKKCGLKIITITDHFRPKEYPKTDVPECEMKVGDLKKYLAIKSDEIDLRIGLEMDYEPGFELIIPDVDYALGSVHIIDGICFDYDEKNFNRAVKKAGNIKNLYLKYFKLVRDLVRSGKFDCVAHMDLIKKFNSNGKYFNENEKEYKNAVLKTLDLIKKKGIVLEINARGLFKPAGEQYPSRWIIKEAFNRGIRITVGSDAHEPDAVCKGYGVIEKLLKEIGYDKVCAFRKRKMEFIAI
jgi:histidinol-phosphatase (PHP family)